MSTNEQHLSNFYFACGVRAYPHWPSTRRLSDSGRIEVAGPSLCPEADRFAGQLATA
jgi:hypothetical protein